MISTMYKGYLKIKKDQSGREYFTYKSRDCFNSKDCYLDSKEERSVPNLNPFDGYFSITSTSGILFRLAGDKVKIYFYAEIKPICVQYIEDQDLTAAVIDYSDFVEKFGSLEKQ
jgi:hypothetical protein